MKYYIIDNSWDTDSKIEIFNSSLPHCEYSIFSTEGLFKSDKFTKRTKSGYWIIQFRKGNNEFESRIKDFINYENKFGRTVLIHTSFDKTYIENILNNEVDQRKDISFFVHSTGIASVDKIFQSKKIIAFSFLTDKIKHFDEIIKYMEAEPSEYKDFVMLGNIEDNTEYVIACNQFGKFIDNKTTIYNPGARIYLDGRKLLSDDLLVFDGVHEAKVYKEIDLEKYALSIISYRDFDRSSWKTTEFVHECNERFKKHPTIAST